MTKDIQKSIQEIKKLLRETDKIILILEKEIEDNIPLINIFERVQQLRSKSGEANHEIVELLLLSFNTYKSNKKDE